MAEPTDNIESKRSRFNPLVAIAAVFLALIGIALALRWYSDKLSMERYCENPGVTISELRRVITDEQLAAGKERTSFIVTSKLLFLVPRRNDEPVEDYLARVRQQLETICR